MLKNRIIPCLDVKDGRVVKGVNFTELRDAGDPVEQARLYDEQGADELCFLDITATSDDRSIFYDVVTKVAEQCFMPLTVGGGVRTVEDVRKLLLAGADKVAINTAAIKNPELIAEAAEKFGSQCIVVAIDAKMVDKGRYEEKNTLHKTVIPAKAGIPVSTLKNVAKEIPAFAGMTNSSQFQIFTHGGRQPTGIDAVQWAKKVAGLGAGEILLTSMDRDGTKKGVHLDLTKAVSGAVSIPVIASGGIGSVEHFIQAVKEGQADAVLAASVFHYGQLTIAEVKEAMQQAGIPVRLVL